jgi:hypothetical protein
MTQLWRFHLLIERFSQDRVEKEMDVREARGILGRLDLFLEDLLIEKMMEVDEWASDNRHHCQHLVLLTARRNYLDFDQ